MQVSSDEMIPFFRVASIDFEKDLNVLKKVLYRLELKTHLQGAYKFSSKAELAIGWWFYDIFFRREFVRRLLELDVSFNSNCHKWDIIKRIVEPFQKQLRLLGSEARISLYSDRPTL